MQLSIRWRSHKIVNAAPVSHLKPRSNRSNIQSPDWPFTGMWHWVNTFACTCVFTKKQEAVKIGMPVYEHNANKCHSKILRSKCFGMTYMLHEQVCTQRLFSQGSSLHFFHFVQLWHTDSTKIDFLSDCNQILFVSSIHYECVENAIEKGVTMSNPEKEEFEWDHVFCIKSRIWAFSACLWCSSQPQSHRENYSIFLYHFQMSNGMNCL